MLHYTAMESFAAARARLCDPEAGVSAHWLIGMSGETCQLVAEERRAWHAGAGAWGKVSDVNSRSIGIELANSGTHPFPEPQMAALESLLAEVTRRWSVPPERVIGHSDMAPGRKPDPGPRFDWRRLSRRGFAVAAGLGAGASEPPSSLDALLRRIGYTADVTEEVRLAAFRLRHRPWARGAGDATDLAFAADLARRFPVDRPAATA